DGAYWSESSRLGCRGIPCPGPRFWPDLYRNLSTGDGPGEAGRQPIRGRIRAGSRPDLAKRHAYARAWAGPRPHGRTSPDKSGIGQRSESRGSATLGSRNLAIGWTAARRGDSLLHGTAVRP